LALPTIPEITFKFVGKPDNLNSILDPDEIKAVLDAGPEEIRQAAIALTNALSSITDNSSGADNIGATAISTSPATVQGILEWLKAQIDTIVAGGVADGSVTDAKLSGTAGQIKERVATHVALSSSETVKGHVELATPTETTAGTDNTRAVTPLGLKSATDLLIPLSQKGANSGIASLNAIGKLTASQRELPLFEVGDMELKRVGDGSGTIGQVNDDVWAQAWSGATFNYSGTFRITFGLLCTTSGQNAYGRIYKNGVPYGIQRISTSSSGTSFAEDLAFNAGDVISIWGKTDTVGTPYMRVTSCVISVKPYVA
jgi:hypothetical protein